MEKHSADTNGELLPLPVKKWPEVLDPSTNQIETLSGRRVALMGQQGIKELNMRRVLNGGDTLDKAVDSGDLTHSR
jgi:hypothetical protein